eukprot:RCo031830
MAADSTLGASVELEHALGFNGRRQLCLSVLPPRTAVYPIGRLLVLDDLGDPHRQIILRGHDAEITAVDVSASGRWVVSCQRAASGDSQGSVLVWDVQQRQVVHCFKGHKGAVLSCAFSPDERWVASTGEDGRLCLWEMETGQLCGGSRPSG